jgi:hypothetical protein
MVFSFLGDLSKWCDSRVSYFILKKIHLQVVGIQTQSTIKIQNNLVIDMCACYCGHDFVSFNNVDC